MREYRKRKQACGANRWYMYRGFELRRGSDIDANLVWSVTDLTGDYFGDFAVFHKAQDAIDEAIELADLEAADVADRAFDITESEVIAAEIAMVPVKE